MIVLSTPNGGSSSTITIPNVIHVTTAGNDTTGDGTLAKPYATGSKAWQVAGSNPRLIKFGFGNFTAAIDGNGWPSTLEVGGPVSTVLTINSVLGDVVLRASGLTITVNGSSPLGSPGASTSEESTNGGNAGSTNRAPNVSIIGTCTVMDVISIAGDAGPGGDSTHLDSPGTGGNGGDGGDGGTIILKVPFVKGTISTLPGQGGIGGLSAAGNGSNGANGAAGSIRIDGANVEGASFPQGWGASRCTYYTGQPVPSPDNGNILFN